MNERIHQEIRGLLNHMRQEPFNTREHALNIAAIGGMLTAIRFITGESWAMVNANRATRMHIQNERTGECIEGDVEMF